ncbi:MAG: DinB family protein [Burkholderiales bacterium]|jgi:uncharacterized damage-inducible protein DinB|nr:DinB family protein [Burkholderiales bacterium]
MDKARYVTLAGYNRWANDQIYGAAAGLPDADYRADRGAFFRSVHGTLNHILVGDRIWLHRFTGEGELLAALDAILFDDLAALRSARIAEDQRIVRWIDGLAPAALDGTFRYVRAADGKRYEQQLGPALDHFFNHQTHHRGQVHALLTGLVGDAPSLDLHAYMRDFGLGGFRTLDQEPARQPMKDAPPQRS